MSEIRDLEATVNAGFANQQTCCCETQKALLENRYLAAQNTAQINANTTAQMQKLSDEIKQNKIEALQGRINQLELSNALSGVVRYPTAMTYSLAGNPFCNCNSMCCGNI